MASASPNKKWKWTPDTADHSPYRDQAGAVGRARYLLAALGQTLDEIAAKLERVELTSPSAPSDESRKHNEAESSETEKPFIGTPSQTFGATPSAMSEFSNAGSLSSAPRRATLLRRLAARNAFSDANQEREVKKRWRVSRPRVTITDEHAQKNVDPLANLAKQMKVEMKKDKENGRERKTDTGKATNGHFMPANSTEKFQINDIDGIDQSGVEIMCTSEDKASNYPSSTWQDCDGTVAPERARMENGLELPSSWSVPEGLTPESWEHLKTQMEAQNVTIVDWLQGNETTQEEGANPELLRSPTSPELLDCDGFALRIDAEISDKYSDFDGDCIVTNQASLSVTDSGAHHGVQKNFGADGLDSEDVMINTEMTLTKHSSVKILTTAEMEMADKEALQLAAEHGQAKQKISRCMLSPASLTRVVWDLVWCCCLLFDLWLTPFQVVYLSQEVDLPRGLAIASIVVIVYYFCDIVLNFRTGYTQTYTDLLIMDQRLVAIRYLTGWFWFDIFVTMPWDEIFKSDGDGDVGGVRSTFRAAKASKAFRVLKVLKLLRIFRLFKTFKDLRFAKVKRAEKALLRKEAKRRRKRKASVIRQVVQVSEKVYAPVGNVISGLVFLVKPTQIVVVLLCFAHFHACIWWAIRPDGTSSVDLDTALDNYFEAVCIFFGMLTFGAPLSTSASTISSTLGLWIFEMVVQTERMILVMELTRSLLLEALIQRGEDAQMMVYKEGAMNYMMRHDISAAAQLQVLQSVSDTGGLQKTQRHFKNFMTNSVPPNLGRAICEELWTGKLLSLGLIEEVNDWDENLVVQLTQEVQEEVYAPKVVVFREGDFALNAYKVLSGEVIIVAAKKVLPPFTSGMWIGEKVLVNPDLRRSATMVTKTVCTLMAVPGDIFYDLVTALNLMDRFQTFCSEELWRGLCGRCGVLGDHFAQECPLLQKKSHRQTFWKSVGKRLRKRGRRISSGVIQPSIAPDLRMFLEHKDLNHLSHDLFRLGIIDLQDLEDAQSTKDSWLDEDAGFESAEMEQLSLQAIQDFRNFKVDTSSNLFLKSPSINASRSDHFMFLSHYKVEAGSEAALMRMELEHLLGQEASHSSNQMDCPIFLDSDNLTNLDDLQERVRASWNLLVLLTPGVLRRPYCLVEIATALAANIQVILINVDKPGQKFEFPNDKFYEEFMAGKILSRPDVELLEQYNCTLAGVRDAIRQSFIRIALPYSPHRATGIRQAELKAILEQCVTKPTREDNAVGKAITASHSSQRMSHNNSSQSHQSQDWNNSKSKRSSLSSIRSFKNDSHRPKAA